MDKKTTIVVGLTGNIASGKSTVASIFRELGAKIIDADKIAREVVKPGSDAWKEIVKSFGKEILNKDETINRKKLGAIVFKDPLKRKKLNEITHPRIVKKIYEQVEELKKKNVSVVIVEAALIVEKGGMRDLLDKLIVVTLPEQKQIKRLMERDSISYEEALNRVSSQAPQAEKVKYADYVIDTSGTVEETKKQVLDIWKDIQKAYTSDV